MALGTDHQSSTTLAVLIPEIWGERINDFFRQALTMADFFIDRSDELTDGGDIIHTPNLTEMSANTKSNGSEVTLNASTETDVDLTVTTWEEVSFLIEDREAATVKRSYTLQERYAMNAGYTTAAQLEDAIAALFSGFSNTVGASTTNLADSEIRAALATLQSNNVPWVMNGRQVQDVAFFLHPNVFWRQVQSLDRFAVAQNSPVNDPTAKQPAAFLYGVPVFITTSCPFVSGSTGRYGFVGHRDAIHWATQSLGAGGSLGAMVGSSGVRVQSNYIPEYLGTLTTADICYGVVENRDNAGVAILTHATFA